MDEQPMYRVCPDRNIAAAYERFFGPDSGGIDRFCAAPVVPRRPIAGLAETFNRRRPVQLANAAASMIRTFLSELGSPHLPALAAD